MPVLLPMAGHKPIPLVADHYVKSGAENKGTRIKTALLGIAYLSCLWYPNFSVALAGGIAETSLKLSPAAIEMGTFYNGEKVRVQGIAPLGSEVVVAVRGATNDEFFNRKGRVGPIWVNADRVHIMGIPSLLLTFGSGAIGSMLAREVTDAYQLDETAVMKHLRCKVHCKCKAPTDTAQCLGVIPDEIYLESIRADLSRLKIHEGTYRTTSGTVLMGEAANRSRPFSLEFLWPPRASAGSYSVEVYFCHKGSVVGQISSPLSVVEVGFPARMASLAKENGLLYGLLAVVVAGLAGFGMDFLAARLRRRKDKSRRRTEVTHGHHNPQLNLSGTSAQPTTGAEPEVAKDSRLPLHH